LIARSPRRPYLLLLLVVVVLDQVTKWLVDRSMDLHDSRVVVEGLVSLTYVQNRGAAFGVFSDAQLPYQPILFSLVSVAALCGIAAYAWRLPAASRLPQTALALIMGGAVGNLVDRARLGHVVDFVDFYWKSHHWPAFNVADSAITVGVCLLILDMVLSPEPGENATAEVSASPLARSE
jgi:signal peptidase II